MPYPKTFTGDLAWRLYGKKTADSADTITLATLRTHFGITDDNAPLGNASRIPITEFTPPEVTPNVAQKAVAGSRSTFPQVGRVNLPEFNLSIAMADLPEKDEPEGKEVLGPASLIAGEEQGNDFFLFLHVLEPGESATGEVGIYYQCRVLNVVHVPAAVGSDEDNRIRIDLSLTANPIAVT